MRSFHALAFTFVDKSDSEHNRIAFANFVGVGSQWIRGNLYLPAGFNDHNHAETRIAIAFGSFAAQNLLREFTPELLKATQVARAVPSHPPACVVGQVAGSLADCEYSSGQAVRKVSGSVNVAFPLMLDGIIPLTYPI